MKDQSVRHPNHNQLRAARLRWIALKKTLIVVALAAVAVLGAVAFLALRPAIRTSTQPRSPTPPTVGLAVGNLAPDFRLTDVFGRSVSRPSLVTDRPGLLFFTTTYCAPCVEGLRALTRFQNEVGANRFNVLVTFVDPGELPAALRAYQQEYGLPQTWFYALDANDMVSKYRLRALDTKYVLDRAGVIHFTDVYPASYDTWRRALALVGVTPK